jgi:hypothetical protein
MQAGGVYRQKSLDLRGINNKGKERMTQYEA